VVANPPWATTDAVVSRLLAPGSRLVRADLLLKRPAARRWSATRVPGYDLAVGASVSRRAFRPPPPIDARVLTIERR
jgi:23S rRNA (adenine-N6)-dimethyltransferase